MNTLQLQEICRSSLGVSSPTPIHALLCATSLDMGDLKSTLCSWGLIHLMVVSGAHFIFVSEYIQKFIRQFRGPEVLSSFFLLLFFLATGFQAPLLRAGLSSLLKVLSNRFKYFWSPAHIIGLSGGISLLILDTSKYLSLQLSWGSALLIKLSQSSPNKIQRQFLIWFGLLPLLVGLGWSHPLSIIANLVAIPLFEFIAFPAIWVMQFLSQFFSIWPRLPLDILDKIPALPLLPTPHSNLFLSWFYLLILQTLALCKVEPP
ncbi:MAG: ComEC/Rec2 family competence protein [Bdellovibrionales bacterium]|nr:ComEC/Rec2 family competence protein [Bdellovibrionales bacterium]